MELAPVEYLIIRFPGNRFTGEIAPAIADLVARGTVHILDLVFVTKDADGNVTAVEFDDMEGADAFTDIDGEAEGLLNEEDIEIASEALEPNSSALFIVWEDLWAADLARAVLASGGELVVGERIPHTIVEAAFAGTTETES